MDRFLMWVNLIGGAYLIILSFLSETKNLRSAFVFKVALFFLGLCCLVMSLQNLKLINIF